MLVFQKIEKECTNEGARKSNLLIKTYASECFLVSVVMDFSEEDITHLPEEMYQFLKETPVEARVPDKPIRYLSVDLTTKDPALANYIRGRFDHFTKTMDYSFGDSMRNSKQDALAEDLMKIEKVLQENWDQFVDFANKETLGGAAE